MKTPLVWKETVSGEVAYTENPFLYRGRYFFKAAMRITPISESYVILRIENRHDDSEKLLSKDFHSIKDAKSYADKWANARTAA